MWFIENITENKISGILAKTIPLNKNMHDGIIERDSAFSLLFLFQQIIQNIKYAMHNAPFIYK